MRHVIIGDVHGCIDELKELVEKCVLTQDDKLVFVGDLVDKGPDSLGVLKYVRKLMLKGFNVHVVLGNHEEKHLRWVRNEKRHKETGRKNKMTPNDDILSITPQYDDCDLAMLNMATLFYRHGDLLVTHAGVPPFIETLETNYFFRQLHGKRKNKYGQLLRVRFVDRNGRMIHLGHETDDDSYWADVYDGRFGHVVFGHQAFMDEDPARYDHATGIDLGCAYGGFLCAMVVNDTSKMDDVTFVKVRARKKYSKSRAEKEE